MTAALTLLAGGLTALPAGAAERAAMTERATSAKPLTARLLDRAQLRTRPGGRIVTTLGTLTEYGSPRVLAVVARSGRWLGVLSESMPNGRAGWIPAASAELGRPRYALEADRSERLLTVRHDGRIVRRIHVAVGRAATATPVGLYAVTDALRIAGGSGAYGCCALPITGHAPNVPPDRNRLGIHGTSAEGSIGSAASAGCLRGRSTDMRWLVIRIPAGTPLRIRA